MADARYDIVGIGNAIVDIVAHVDDSFLNDHNLEKGAMTLIDSTVSDQLYAAVDSVTECSGGSGANTVAVLATLGGKGVYVGKVRDDALGQTFRQDIHALGATFETSPLEDGPATARCMVFVTPDAERTMQTYLGACVELGPDDIDEETIAAAHVTYMEGYLWDPPQAKQAFLKAAKIAHESGRLVSLSLSDSFCVTRHHDEFLALVRDHVDVLFANEDEIMTLYGASSFDEALQKVRHHCGIAALTRGPGGSVVVSGNDIHVLDAAPADKVIDTTGAGDAYAGGFLYGLTQGCSIADCGRIGGIAASDIIGQFGARPQAALKAKIRSVTG